MDNKHYLLALNRFHSVGPRTIAKLLLYWPNLAELFHLSLTHLEQAGISPQLAEAIVHFDCSKLEEDLLWEETSNHYILTWEDPKYPALLKEIDDPPPVLYAIGDLSCLQQQAIAIVGTRKPSIMGNENAWQFAYTLALHQITIVSGLAFGIDAQAHMGCLKANGKTIAVMGTGVDCIYPAQHKKLAEQICINGLLLSEFPLHTPPSAKHFPRRNRIISGLACGTLVVEAALRSGSLITARLAIEQNRDVFAIPSSIHNPQARGCHHLLQQGAKLVTACEDIIDELPVSKIKQVVDKKMLSLASGSKNLVKCIGFEITTIDQMVQRSGISIEKVMCALAELELAGIVQTVPGGYMRCSS